MKAIADKDIRYYHQAMRQPDRAQFKEAVRRELEALEKSKTYTIRRRDQIPKSARILPMVWQLRRKRDQATGEVLKYKARLNVDGSKMIKGRDYVESYAPVTTWDTVRLMLTLTLVHGWHSCQVDYVRAYPQAPIERRTLTKIPPGMEVEGN